MVDGVLVDDVHVLVLVSVLVVSLGNGVLLFGVEKELVEKLGGVEKLTAASDSLNASLGTSFTSIRSSDTPHDPEEYGDDEVSQTVILHRSHYYTDHTPPKPTDYKHGTEGEQST